mgnify:CR=1 FL=1
MRDWLNFRTTVNPATEPWYIFSEPGLWLISCSYLRYRWHYNRLFLHSRQYLRMLNYKPRISFFCQFLLLHILLQNAMIIANHIPFIQQIKEIWLPGFLGNLDRLSTFFDDLSFRKIVSKVKLPEDYRWGSARFIASFSVKRVLFLRKLQALRLPRQPGHRVIQVW